MFIFFEQLVYSEHMTKSEMILSFIYFDDKEIANLARPMTEGRSSPSDQRNA